MTARYRCTACGAELERRSGHECERRIVRVVDDVQARATALCDALDRFAVARAAVLAGVVLAAVGCSNSHDRRDVVVEPSDAGVEWVSGREFCDRIEALGCSVACIVDQVCDRARADACLDYVESVNEPGTCEAQPRGLDEPICTGICVPVDVDGGGP